MLPAAAGPETAARKLGGGQLWKRSLETTDPAEARCAFTIQDAELEARFAADRAEIAERASRTLLTPEPAYAAVARAAAMHRGSQPNRFPALSTVLFAEEAASKILGGVRIAGFTDSSPAGLAEMNPDHVPEDVWRKAIETRIGP